MVKINTQKEITALNTENLLNLKINKITKEKYNDIKSNIISTDTDLYLVPDDIKPNWAQADSAADDFIKNKPDLMQEFSGRKQDAKVDSPAIIATFKDTDTITMRPLSGLTKIYLGGFGTIKVYATAEDFEEFEHVDGCEVNQNIQSLEITYDSSGEYQCEFYGVTSISAEALRDCTNLTSAVIHDSVTSIGNEAFRNCSNLTSVTIGNGVTTIGVNAFYNCASLESVVIPNSVVTVSQQAFYSCTNLDSVAIGNSVKSIGHGAFYGCSNLTSIVIPDSVTSIGSNAFSSCDSLTSVVIGDSVTYIGNFAFNSCDNLKSITIKANTPPTLGAQVFLSLIPFKIIVPAMSYESYKNADSWTDYADYLHYLVLKSKLNRVNHLTYYQSMIDATTTLYGNRPDKVKKVTPSSGTTTLGPNNIYNEAKAADIIIVADGVTSIAASTFSGCAAKAIILPDSITSIGNRAFMKPSGNSGITNLANIVIPYGVQSIDVRTFADCKLLTSIYIPDSVTSIGDGAFNGCTELTSIILPSNITNIKSSAFANCTNLIKVVIPKSVTYVGLAAFSREENNLDIYCECASMPKTWDSAWDGVYPNSSATNTVYWYSDSKPTATGNYWRYVNGVPTKW
jgi:hypothetical protein